MIDRPTNQPTDGHEGSYEVTLPINGRHTESISRLGEGLPRSDNEYILFQNFATHNEENCSIYNK